MTSGIAKRYALALYDLARETNSLEPVLKDMGLIENLISASDEFKFFLQNPSIPSPEKIHIISNIFKSHIHHATHTFLSLITQKNRLDFLAQVCLAFKEHYLFIHGILPITIKTSVPLPPHQANAIIQRFKDKLGQEFDPKFEVNSKILGGLTAQIHDTVYDMSLKTQLDRFYQKILMAQ